MKRQLILICGIVLLTLAGCLLMIYRLTFRVPDKLVGAWENAETLYGAEPGELRIIINSDGTSDQFCVSGDSRLAHMMLGRCEVRVWASSYSLSLEGLPYCKWRVAIHRDSFVLSDPVDANETQTWRRVATSAHDKR